jgi:ribosomal subunit interface protein
MKIQITFRNIEDSLHQDLSEKMAALAKKLERHAARFASEVAHLHVLLEKSSHHPNLHRVELRLSVPGRILISEKVDESFAAAAKGAFAELERQLIEHLERMRREDEWRRKERRQHLHRLKAAASARPQEERLLFKRVVLPHLSVLRRFVRFELSHPTTPPWTPLLTKCSHAPIGNWSITQSPRR